MKKKKMKSFGLAAIVLISVVVAYTLPVLANGTVVSIGDISAPPDGTVTESIMASDVDTLVSVMLNITYNPSVVHVTDVVAGTGNSMGIVVGNPDNTTGVVRISAIDVLGKSGDVIIANVTFKAVGSAGSFSNLNISVTKFKNLTSTIPHTVDNGTFTVSDNEEPSVTDPSANPATILNDNGRPRPPGTNISQLNITVTDNSAVDSVNIDLSPIGRSTTQSMMPGSTLYTVKTNATAGINLTHNLAVNATDINGNSNISVSIPLTVLRRGDIVRDNVVDTDDALYILRYSVGLETEPSMLVADVQPAEGDNLIDTDDALYILRYTVGLEDEP